MATAVAIAMTEATMAISDRPTEPHVILTRERTPSTTRDGVG
jgi:hypothetical protein